MTWGLSAAQILNFTRGSDGAIAAFSRTGGANNPAIAISTVDGAGGSVQVNLAVGAALGLAIGGTNVISLSAAQAGFANGAVGAPSLAFASELATGLYRVGAADVGVAISGVQTLDLQGATHTHFGTSVASLVNLTVSNTNTVAGNDARLRLLAGSTDFALFCVNQNSNSVVVTGGPTTAQACLRTLGAQPLVFGTNNLAVMQMTSAQAIQGWGQVAAAFVDMTPDTGSWLATLTGCTTAPTGTIVWARLGPLVFLLLPNINATSNTTACTLTGAMPPSIQPTRTQISPVLLSDNSVSNNGGAQVSASSTITLQRNTAGGGGYSATFTNSGTKGCSGGIICYLLT